MSKFDFKTGTTLVFSDDSIGRMAQFWKTSGSGEVGNLPDQSGKMHVVIEVRDKQMVVYLDKVKVLDTEMFANDQERKYFYISTGTKLSNGAQIGINNFNISSF